MSKVFNMVGGGGGKNISSIIITGLESTDIVTCTKDGKSYTATWDETAQHFEIVGLSLGTFTVTATNGTKTITETVLIDIVGVYEVEMSFKLWLYRDGDEREDVTGGWSTQFTSTTQGAIDKGGSSITLTTVNSGTYNIAIETVNRIDKSILSAYSKLCISYSLNNDRASYLGLTDTVGANPHRVAIVELRSSETYYELSIPETISDDYYVFVNAWGIGSAKTILTVKRVWLE